MVPQIRTFNWYLQNVVRNAYQTIKSILQMEMFLNSRYEGLSQLLAVPLTMPKSPSYSPLSHSSPSNTAPATQKLKPVGFTPFRLPEKLDMFELCNLKSTSEEASESFPSECLEELDGGRVARRKNKKGPYRKYTIEEKRMAVEYVRCFTNLNQGRDLKSVAKEFNIPRRNLLRWRKNGCERKEGGGRPTDADMENRIHDMIRNQLITTEKEIRDAAKKLSSLKNFKASKGWFVKFCRRFQLQNLQGQCPQV